MAMTPEEAQWRWREARARERQAKRFVWCMWGLVTLMVLNLALQVWIALND